MLLDKFHGFLGLGGIFGVFKFVLEVLGSAIDVHSIGEACTEEVAFV